MNGACSTNGEKRNAVFWWRGGGGSGRRRELRRPMRRSEDNVQWMLNEDDRRAWIGFIWLDRYKRRNFVHTLMNFRIPQMSVFFE